MRDCVFSGLGLVPICRWSQMYSCLYTGNLKHIRQGWVLEHERKNGWAHEIVPEKSSTQRVTGNLFIFLSLDRPGEPVRHIFILSGAPLSKSKFLGFIPGCLYDTTCDPCKDQPVWQFWVGSNTALFGVSGWVASIVSHPVLQRSPWRWRRRTEGGRSVLTFAVPNWRWPGWEGKMVRAQKEGHQFQSSVGSWQLRLTQVWKIFPCDSDGKICWTYVVEINHKFFRLGIPVNSEHWHSRSASTNSRCGANVGCTKDQHSEAKAAEKSEEFWAHGILWLWDQDHVWAIQILNWILLLISLFVDRFPSISKSPRGLRYATAQNLQRSSMLCSTVVQSTRSGAASKTQKNIGTRDEKRTEGAMAFYDIDCNNNNHHHHYHYYYHYLYKPLKMVCIELTTPV